MSVAIIQARYDELNTVAARLGHSAEQTELLLQRLRAGIEPLQSGGWIGRGSRAFFGEMNTHVLPGVSRMIVALAEARAVTLEMIAIMRAAEEDAAALFRNGQFSPLASQGTSAIQEALSILGKHWDKMVAGAIGLLEVRDIWRGLTVIAGSSYPGQMIIRGSHAIKELAGISPYLTHLKWNAAGRLKLLGGVIKESLKDPLGLSSTVVIGGKKIPIGKVMLAIDIGQNLFDNIGQYENADPDLKWEKVAVGTAVDSAVSMTGSAVGGVVGTAVGGLVGSLFTPAGTVIGAKIGGAIGGVAGSLAVSWMEEQPWYASRRDELVDQGAVWLDQNLDRAGAAVQQTYEKVERGLSNVVSSVSALFD